VPFVNRRVVIFAKTYPEPSTRYTETVCTGGLGLEDGCPIRLYPVPLRYLEGDKQYGLWDVIQVPVDRSSKDRRPESFKIDPAGIHRVGHLDSDSDGWATRRTLLERDQSWHFSGMQELNEANRSSETSIGLVAPGVIERVELAAKSDDERDAFERKCAELRAQRESDMFDSIYHTLDFLTHEIFLHWRCSERCPTCTKKPHRMKVLDWGLMQLARKKSWDAAVQRMQEISDLQRYDFRLILGNFAQHPRNFGIIALWYPKIAEQMGLF
jgi:hypothetical protein